MRVSSVVCLTNLSLNWDPSSVLKTLNVDKEKGGDEERPKAATSKPSSRQSIVDQERSTRNQQPELICACDS